MSRFPSAPWVEVAVSGRSNVGKSSLLNTLFGRKNFARISKDPGKTRTVNFFLVNDRFYLVDLPGYGYAKISAGMRRKWKKLIYDYIETRQMLGGVILLIDSRHDPMKEDLRMLQHLVDSGKTFLVVFTKADKIGRSARSHVMREFRSHFEGFTVGLYVGAGGGSGKTDKAAPDIPAAFFSARTGEGRNALWSWIEGLV